jgi:hypothetical protein
MSLVANTFLSDRSLKIRSKAIPWDVRRRLLTLIRPLVN